MSNNVVKVYVYRNTIEKDYDGPESLALLTLDSEFMDHFVNKFSEYDNFKSWSDFYTCEDTKDLYRLASTLCAVKDIKYEKPVVYEDVLNREVAELAYSAMRKLELIGKGEAGRELYNSLVGTKKKMRYVTARRKINDVIDVVIKESKLRCEESYGVHVMIDSEPEVDCYVMVNSDVETEQVETYIRKSYHRWMDKNDEVGDTSLLEFIKDRVEKKYKDSKVYVQYKKSEGSDFV